MNLTPNEIKTMVGTMSRDERKNWVQHDGFNTWELGTKEISPYKSCLEMATGVGKTRIGVMAVQKELILNSKAVIYIMVPTTTLQTVDWPDEFRKWGCEDLLPKVKIVCHASMHRTVSKTGEVDLLIWDEAHHATTKSSIFFTNNKVYKVLGLSATLPKETKNEEDAIKRAILDQYCPSIYKVSLEEAIALELVADFSVKVLRFKLDDVTKIDWGTPGKPVMRTEQAQYKHLTANVAKSMYVKKLEKVKFKFIQERVAFLRNLPSKLKLAKTCMKQMIDDDNRTLIFCGSIKQAHELCGTQVYHSQTTDEQLTRFQNKEINYLGAISALDEGKNLSDLDQLLIVALNSNERSAIQKFGRSLRQREGHKALIAILVAKDTADEKWVEFATENFEKSRFTYYNVNV